VRRVGHLPALTDEQSGLAQSGREEHRKEIYGYSGDEAVCRNRREFWSSLIKGARDVALRLEHDLVGGWKPFHPHA